MTINIKAPKAWRFEDELVLSSEKCFPEDKPVRIVRESDWRKLMKLVRLLNARSTSLFADEQAALDAIRARGEK